MIIQENTDERRFHVFSGEQFVDLNVYQFGWEKCAPLHSFGPYVRNHYLFHYVISGKGIFRANGHSYPVHAGQGFLIFPNHVTSYSADQDEPWEYTWVEFDGIRVQECLRLAGLSLNQPIWQSLDQNSANLLLEKIQNLVEFTQVPSDRARYANSHSMQIVGYGFLFLDQLVHSSAYKDAGSTKRLRDFYIKEAIAFLEQNYHRDIVIEEIASVCGLSKNYFGKIFKEGMGESPQQFLIRYRMSKASHLLKESKLPIHQISAMVSYLNQLHFSRAFKSVYGMSPRDYRQKYFVDNNYHELP